MNKKIFGGIAIVAIAVAVAFNVTLSNQKQDKASLLALANVEALAQSEIIDYVIGAMYCPCAGYACPHPYGGNIQWNPYEC